MADVLGSTLLREVAYLVAACICALAAARSVRGVGRRDVVATEFWLGAAALLVILAISREVELSARVANVGRDLFRREGWYPDRRPVQRLAVYIIIALAGFVGLAGSLAYLRRGRMHLIFGWLALVTLVGFLAVRAISLHYIDAALYRRSIASIQFNAIAELGITLVLALTAGLFAFPPRRAVRTSWASESRSRDPRNSS